MSTYQYVKNLGFDNVQHYINSESDGTLNKQRLGDMLTFMFFNNWIEIKREDDGNFNYQFGGRDMIKYTTNSNPSKGGQREIVYQKPESRYSKKTDDTNIKKLLIYGSSALKFRSGGWLIDCKDGENGKYLLYKPHMLNQPPISIQFKNIDRLFVLEKNKQKSSNTNPISYVRPEAKDGKTKFKVELYSQIVYYASDEYKRKRFISSSKFQGALKNGFRFTDDYNKIYK